jgi:hypothetical protein
MCILVKGCNAAASTTKLLHPRAGLSEELRSTVAGVANLAHLPQLAFRNISRTRRLCSTIREDMRLVASRFVASSAGIT